MLVIPDVTWMSKGECQQSKTPDDWHADRSEDRVAYFRAKSVCRMCPVRLLCLEYAQSSRQPEGIWGGMDAEERFEMRKRLLRNRAMRRVITR